jgi:hypothetical protein
MDGNPSGQVEEVGHHQEDDVADHEVATFFLGIRFAFTSLLIEEEFSSPSVGDSSSYYYPSLSPSLQHLPFHTSNIPLATISRLLTPFRSPSTPLLQLRHT